MSMTRLRRLILPAVLAGSLGVFGTAVASINATAERLELAATPPPAAPAPDVSPRSWECDEPDRRVSTPDPEARPAGPTRSS